MKSQNAGIPYSTYKRIRDKQDEINEASLTDGIFESGTEYQVNHKKIIKNLMQELILDF